MAPACNWLAPALLAPVLLVPALLVVALLVVPAGAETINAEPLIPDSASGAGADPELLPEAALLPALATPAAAVGGPPGGSPTPSPVPATPDRPSEVPGVVPVGDLSLNHQPPGEGAAPAAFPGALHYPLAMAASEQDPWGWRFSVSRRAWRMHTGVDLIVPEGTAVLAVQSGRVLRVDVIAGYGLTVLIDHGAGWSILYAHLLEASVRPGETVLAAQPLGLVGESGNASTPHLHLELRQHQPQGLVAVDPMPLMPAGPGGGAIAGDSRR